MTDRFDDRLLKDFMHKFYGYGTYNGDFWFIGMEEGGGISFKEITRRLTIWKERGRRELEDIANYHIELGMSYLFDEHPRLQRTWAGLIRVLLSADGREPTIEQVRNYQQTSLARSNGETCLVELFPLPSPSTGQWLYGKHSRLSYLIDRKTYRRALLPMRSLFIQQRIKEYRPKVVVFYSFAYREYWQDIAGVDFSPAKQNGMYISRAGPSVFAVIKHPAARGVTNEYYYQVGKAISAEILRY